MKYNEVQNSMDEISQGLKNGLYLDVIWVTKQYRLSYFLDLMLVTKYHIITILFHKNDC